ncbi:MAG TPA: YihY/virulence factor BrkB family protein [Thermoanaerobaculia bacterium]|nr:YihY/virulence factor BrkB family protein [Thermoanaerobaculia bacterium]
MPLTRTLAGRVLRESFEDGITGEAAKAAYYFFLSFFPTILALFAFTGIFGGNQAFDWIMDHLRRALPGEAAGHLASFVAEVTGESRPGMLSVGLLLALWSASNVFAVLTAGLNAMYDIEEGRPWWKRRLIALGALVAGLVLLTGAAASLLAGPALIELLRLPAVWYVLRWPLAFLALVLMLSLVYWVLPARDQSGRWRPVLIGAAVGAALWVLGTFGFRLYVASFARYSTTYGFVGGIIVLLLWLYVTALAILFGGEVAATLEQVGRERRAAGSVTPGRDSTWSSR